MTAVVIPASDADKITGYYYCLDSDGDPESGVVVSLRIKTGPTAGTAYDAATVTSTSDANGLVTFENLEIGMQVEAWRVAGRKTAFTIPTGTTTPYALPAIVG